MNKLIQSISILVISLFFNCLHSAYADIAVIVHPSNSISSISADEVKKIYLGKSKFFSNGNDAVAVDQKSGDIRSKFYGVIVKKEGAALKAYWSKRIFSGKGTPPDIIGDGTAVKAWVSGHAEGIGFIAADKADSTVKVVYTLSQ